MKNRTNQQQGLKPFLSLLLSTNIPKVALSIGIFGSVLTTLVSLTIPALTGQIVDGFSLETIGIGLIIAIIAAFLFQAVMDGISTYLLSASGQRIVASLREKMWKKMIRLPVRYFDHNESGQSVSRIVNDAGIVRDLISRHFPEFISGIISIIGAVIILFIMDWQMTLLMLVSVPVTILIMIPLGKRMAVISRGLQDETAAFSGSIQQTLSEIRLTKASTAEELEEKKGLKGIGRMLGYGLKEARIIAFIAPLMYLIVMAVVVVIIGYGGVRVSQGTMSMGALVAFLLYLFQIIFPITSFAMFFTQLQKAKGATERIINILEIPLEEGQEGLEVDVAEQPILVRDISFYYEEKEPVLQNISFTAAPGEMIAFAGPSGGGKSTLFSLLERYYIPQTGDIQIGDHSIYELSLGSWRGQMGYVSQENAMMAGTIRENLTYGLMQPDKVTDEQLWKAAEMASAKTFIQSFTDGMDTVVGERGVKLSGGQRQRINIARAFLRDPKILMLDEATASLDSQSEHAVQEALSRLMEGRTTLVIAHRLSTIVDANKIIFIERGQITGKGTHQELMKTHELYNKFAEQQLK